MGVERLKSYFLPIVSIWLVIHELLLLAIGTIPPFCILRESLVMIFLRSILETIPRPLQDWQAPFGELKEKLLGSAWA